MVRPVSTTTNFALWLLATYAIGSLGVLLLEVVEEEYGVISRLAESICRGLIWLLLLGILVWRAWRTFPARRLRAAVVIAAICMVLELAVGVVHDIPALENFPVIGRDGTLSAAFAKLLDAVSVCAIILVLYCLLLSLDKASARLSQMQRLEHDLAHLTRVSTAGEMATGLAHEINQPLTAITNFADAAQRALANSDANQNETVSKMLSQIATQAIRAGDIVRSLRNFIKREPPTRTLVRLDHLASEVVHLLAADARGLGIEIVLDLPASAPPVFVDRIQIQQVLLNLMRNAFDSMAENETQPRRVTIDAQWQESHSVTIAVRDTGGGLNSAFTEDLFEPFQTTKRNGLGMGLAISRTIVQAHGGRLWAEPNSPRGAAFFVSLPVDDDTQPDTQPSPANSLNQPNALRV